MAAFMAHGISSAPGWRALRVFAVCAAFATLCNLASILVTLSASDELRLLFARFDLFFAGLYTISWFFYAAATAAKPTPLSPFDRALLGGAAILSSLALVPGLILEDTILARPLPWLGVVYRDAPPTRLGAFTIAYLCVALAILFVRFARRWRRGCNDARASTVAVSATLVAVINDSAARAGLLPTPYLLDIALLVVVLAISNSSTARLAGSVHALEESSRKLADAQAELVKRERLVAIGELAAVVAHEVRNPLAVVFNAIAGLRKVSPATEDHTRLLGIAQEEAERLRDIVSDILDYARPRAPIFSPIDVSDVVRHAIEAALVAKALVETDQVELTSPAQMAPFECDERLIRQAVINLVTNALQADARKSPVAVTVDATDEAIAISVTDDGNGVSREVEERMFTPFFTTRPTGTGLGLAVVQRCAEAHGGSIGLERPGARGARFTLRLQRRAPETERA
ncbi:MAG: hypothetical protein BGO98_43935 [Myxococcales bacterium 68-20]|nr:MAG: hypothetical protein BGO98_43935 [Myxococcales bacterium 68-20]